MCPDAFAQRKVFQLLKLPLGLSKEYLELLSLELLILVWQWSSRLEGCLALVLFDLLRLRIELR